MQSKLFRGHDDKDTTAISEELAKTLPRWVGWIPVVGTATYRRYRRWKVSRLLENLVRVRLRAARVYISEPDVGRVDLSFELVNFSSSAIAVDQAELYALQIGARGMQQLTDVLRAGGGAEPHGLGYAHFGFDLTGADLRGAIAGITPAQNLHSSPNAGVQAHGALILQSGRDRWRASFDAQVDTASYNVSNLALEANQSNAG